MLGVLVHRGDGFDELVIHQSREYARRPAPFRVRDATIKSENTQPIYPDQPVVNNAG